MSFPGPSSTHSAAHPQNFCTTHWSVVLRAGDGPAPEADAALERLCATYWYPIYSWLRRQGSPPHDAQDLTQGFISSLLERRALNTVDRAKGRFRSFLLASLKHYLSNERDRAQALKRGGHLTIVSLDDGTGEDRYQREPARDIPPDKAFEQAWVGELLDGVLVCLRREYAADGKAGLFDVLQGYIEGDRSGVPYAETALRLNLTEGAVKMAVLRLRRRFGELVRSQIAQTVASPAEVDTEIRHLFAAVTL